MAKKENAATVTVAVLDNDGIFLGIETVPESDAAGRVQVPPDVDLKPGAYKWQESEGRFMPIAVQFPGPDKALYDALRTLIEVGAMPVVPSSVTSWMALAAKKNGW
ncbi:hypothetical protein [Thalassospira sp. MCCC 1A01428]|uniref:hypothetical protein n=1 Tax=Thalassospira sp. MCCC 1A01428 TaxID=1470575 RepID=UPI000A1EE971|nr:hypothetical protein [Thalassospira sp. MCCC 1A01428]OSQ33646.1 hypothetical protein THS27_26040 [Thalassospira sp. MCCC 1A01428]